MRPGPRRRKSLQRKGLGLLLRNCFPSVCAHRYDYTIHDNRMNTK